MPIFDTASLTDTNLPFIGQLYNGLDCLLTLEILEELLKHPRANSTVYSFARAMQAPAMDMMRRGVKVNLQKRDAAVVALKKELEAVNINVQILSEFYWKRGLNPNSSTQVRALLFDYLRLPGKGDSADRETLEELQNYLFVMPLINCIISYRKLSKMISVLTTDIDPDGRIRSFYNVVGTVTGRWSAAHTSDDTGTNLQNITESLRYIFEADEGFVIIAKDLSQAESREMGWLFGILFDDWRYLDACESSDLHVAVCKLIWPSLGWNGNAYHDKKIAKQSYIRGFSYRDFSKKAGHATNYVITDKNLALRLKIEKEIATVFIKNYFKQFPAIPLYHEYIRNELKTTRTLTNAFGRSRLFMGDVDSNAVHREAVANNPQSATVDRLNIINWRIWRHLPDVQLLMQLHDALYMQVPEDKIDSSLLKITPHFSIPLTHKNRIFDVPSETFVGRNWGKASEDNPNGLREYTL